MFTLDGADGGNGDGDGGNGRACTEIRVFPASGWAEAEFHKLRALDGILVSGRKVAGNATQFVRIEALRPEAGGGSRCCGLEISFHGPSV